MDVHTPKQRSYNMSRIKGKNTRPELLVRKWLWSSGYRYRLHRKDLPGKPDIIFSQQKKALFVHGCFWHKHNCRFFKWPQTNREFWKKKINKNIRRDQKNYHALNADGWSYLIIWECQVKDENSELISQLKRFIENESDKSRCST
jgi:DNA mismatch endonuclease (patch repair protein)